MEILVGSDDAIFIRATITEVLIALASPSSWSSSSSSSSTSRPGDARAGGDTRSR
jgi:hypothetical protein